MNLEGGPTATGMNPEGGTAKKVAVHPPPHTSISGTALNEKLRHSIFEKALDKIMAYCLKTIDWVQKGWFLISRILL